MSRILQLFFTNPKETRHVHLSAKVFVYGECVNLEVIEFNAIWGALTIQGQYGRNGGYLLDGASPTHLRKVTWFKHFPTLVSLFRDIKKDDLTVYSDGRRIDILVAPQQQEPPYECTEYMGIFDINPTDYAPRAERCVSFVVEVPLDGEKKAHYEVALYASEERDGIFLRWIDMFGYVQQYLFVEGKNTYKTSVSKTAIPSEEIVNGVYYDSLVRPISISGERQIKCCAVNLQEHTHAYVQTITTATIVDMYLGKDPNGKEVWVPVIIEKGSFNTDPQKVLTDLEITITLPEEISQELW